MQALGVEGYFGAADVPGDNAIGAIIHDEELFATTEVTCVGQVRSLAPTHAAPASNGHLCRETLASCESASLYKGEIYMYIWSLLFMQLSVPESLAHCIILSCVKVCTACGL